MPEKFLIERKVCKNSKCKAEVIHLVNNEYCIKCYQAFYYKNITKKKRKNKKRRISKPWYLMDI